MAEDTTEVKDSPPTQPSFRQYIQQKRRGDISELEAALEKPKLAKETRNMEGMSPTPKEELKRESLVKLTAKIEGTTPEKVEENLEQRKVPAPPVSVPQRDYRLKNILRRVEGAEIAAQKRSEEAAQKSVARVQEKLQNREAIRQDEAARKTAIAEALRPKSFSEMAASRRGNLPEKATSYHITESKQTGPLPPILQTPKPQANAPKAEQTLRQKLPNAPQPQREGGLRKFINKLLGKA